MFYSLCNASGSWVMSLPQISFWNVLNFILSRVIGESTTGPTRTHCMWSSLSLSLSSSFLFRASSSMLSLALVQVSVGISLLHCILTNHTSKYFSLLDLTFLTCNPLHFQFIDCAKVFWKKLHWLCSLVASNWHFLHAVPIDQGAPPLRGPPRLLLLLCLHQFLQVGNH